MVARILSADLRICADMDPVSSLPQLPQSPRIEQIARLFAADANCCTLGLNVIDELKYKKNMKIFFSFCTFLLNKRETNGSCVVY